MAGGETVGKRPSGRRSNYRRDHGEASSVGEAGGRRGRLVVKEKETDFQFFFCLYFIRGYFWSRIVCSLRVYYGLGCVGMGLGGTTRSSDCRMGLFWPEPAFGAGAICPLVLPLVSKGHQSPPQASGAQVRIGTPLPI
jgi:hypothetical protein